MHGFDYESHGRSDGLVGLIDSFDRIVDDARAHFAGVRASAAARGLAAFIFGESLGGAVALHVTQARGARSARAWVMMDRADACACPPSTARAVGRVAVRLRLCAHGFVHVGLCARVRARACVRVCVLVCVCVPCV